MGEKFMCTNYETRELSDSSPFRGPASDSLGLKHQEGVADPFSNQACFDSGNVLYLDCGGYMIVSIC